MATDRMGRLIISPASQKPELACAGEELKPVLYGTSRSTISDL